MDWSKGIQEPGPIKVGLDLGTKDIISISIDSKIQKFQITWDEDRSQSDILKALEEMQKLVTHLMGLTRFQIPSLQDNPSKP